MNIMDTIKNNKKIKNILLVLVAIVVVFLLFVFLNYDKIKRRYFEPVVEDAYTIDNILRINEYDDISDNFRSCILHFFNENGYLESNEFFFTSIPDRAKSVYAFGDFTNTGETNIDMQCMAFVLEENEFKSSRIVIVSPACDVLYSEYFENQIPVINSFKKGANIFINKTTLEPATADGLIIKFKTEKIVLMYDAKTKTFEKYHQYNNEELEEMKYGHDDYDDEPVVEVEKPETTIDTTQK